MLANLSQAKSTAGDQTGISRRQIKFVLKEITENAEALGLIFQEDGVCDTTGALNIYYLCDVLRRQRSQPGLTCSKIKLETLETLEQGVKYVQS